MVRRENTMSLLRKPQPQPSYKPPYKPRDFTGQRGAVEDTGWLSDKVKAAGKAATKYAEEKLGKARVDQIKGLVKGKSKKKEEKEETGEKQEEKEKD